MRKKLTAILLTVVMAAALPVCTYAANSPGTGPVIGGDARLNSRGQSVIGETALEILKDARTAVAGLPENVVTSINGINSGQPLNEVITGVDLTGYNVLVGTQAIVTRNVADNTEKTGEVEVPLYIPNLADGLGVVQVLFYNNFTNTWTVIQPVRMDVQAKTLWFNIPNSGTVSVIYKR